LKSLCFVKSLLAFESQADAANETMKSLIASQKLKIQMDKVESMLRLYPKEKEDEYPGPSSASASGSGKRPLVDADDEEPKQPEPKPFPRKKPKAFCLF